MEDCRYLGKRIGLYIPRGGEPVEIFRCGKFSFCCGIETGLKAGTESIGVCTAACPKFESAQPSIPQAIAATYVNCPHRGPEAGRSVECQCGIDRRIYQCRLKGECLKRLPSGVPKARLIPPMEQVAICAECDDWKPKELGTENPK